MIALTNCGNKTENGADGADASASERALTSDSLASEL
jgi:hypothetical protein